MQYDAHGEEYLIHIMLTMSFIQSVTQSLSQIRVIKAIFFPLETKVRELSFRFGFGPQRFHRFHFRPA